MSTRITSSMKKGLPPVSAATRSLNAPGTSPVPSIEATSSAVRAGGRGERATRRHRSGPTAESRSESGPDTSSSR